MLVIRDDGLVAIGLLTTPTASDNVVAIHQILHAPKCSLSYHIRLLCI